MDYGLIQTAHPRIIIRSNGASPPSTGTIVHWHVDVPTDLLFLGENAGNIGTSTGLRNIGIGKDVLSAHTTGNDNVGMGSGALALVNSGGGNVAIGSSSGAVITTGYGNTFLGNASGQTTTTGIRNTIVGAELVARAASQNDLIAIGSATAGNQGQRVIVDPGLSSVFMGAGGPGNWPTISGTNNVFIGDEAGANKTTAANSVVIGVGAASVGGVGAGNIVAIGFGAASAHGGTEIVAIGYNAGAVASGSSVYVGGNAGQGNSGSNNVAIGRQALDATGAGGSNVAIGANALTASTTGSSNVAVGYNVATTLTSGVRNVIIGSEMEPRASGQTDVIAIGSLVAGNAGQLVVVDPGLLSVYIGMNTPGNWPTSTGVANVAIGDDALGSLTTGGSNMAIGRKSFTVNSTGDNNVGVGEGTGWNYTGSGATFIGQGAGAEYSTGTGAVAIGYRALEGTFANRTTGTGNTAVGYSAGTNVEGAGAHNTLLGYLSGDTITTGVRNILIGSELDVPSATKSDLIAIGPTTAGNLGQRIIVDPGLEGVFIGPGSPGNWPTLTGSRNIAIGQNSGAALTTGTDSVFLGYNTGVFATTAIGMTAIGAEALFNATADGNTAVGRRAGVNVTTGVRNVLAGAWAGETMTANTDEVFVGYEAGRYIAFATEAGGDFNVAVGSQAMRGDSVTPLGAKQCVAVGALALFNIDGGDDNTAVGYNSGNDVTGGARNTFLGSGSGALITTGLDNTFIGYLAGDTETTGSFNIVIGSGRDVPAAGTSNYLDIGALIFGNLSTKRIRIDGSGLVSGDASLDLAGTDGAFMPNRLNNTQEAALTLQNGMVWYNTDSDHFRGRVGGSTQSFQMVDPATNGFRLSPSTGVAVPTSDTLTPTTVYWTPFKSNRVALYNTTTSTWNLHSSAEISYALSGRTTDLPFDLFVYDNAGTLTLEVVNWTNATTRATALTRQDGVWVKSGDASRRYVGSIRPRSATTYGWTVRASAALIRFDLFNAENRVRFAFSQKDTSDHNYTTATWRQWQGSGTYQADFMVGLAEEYVEVDHMSISSNSSSGVERSTAFGYDSTTTVDAASLVANGTGSLTERHSMTTIFGKVLGIGRHFVAILESSEATGTTTWHSASDAAVGDRAGMVGTWTC